MPMEQQGEAAVVRAADLSRMGLHPGRMRPGEVQKVRSKDARGTLRRIWRYLKRQRTPLVIVLAGTVMATLLSLAGPWLIGRIIDDYIVPANRDGFAETGLVLLGVYALGAFFTWVQQYAAASLSQHTVRDMRQDLFAQYQRLPVGFFDRRTHGELMSRAVNDLLNVSDTLNQTVVQFIASVLTLAGCLVMMFSLSVRMTLVTLITVPLVGWIAKTVAKYTRRHFSEQQRQLGLVNGFVQENVAGLKAVKLFVREEKAVAEFREMNGRLREIGIRAQSLSGSMGPIMNALRNLTFVVIAVSGGIFAYYDLVTIGIIASFLSYANQFSQPINQIANQYNMLQAAIAGAERIFEILDEPREPAGPENSPDLPPIRGEVVFDRVTFGYKPDAPVLRDVTLRAEPGQMIALVGPTGAGKTTIINLLTRFYDIQEGRILIDGRDIRELDPRALRRQIGLVLQDAHVFSGTIRENIRYGRLDATDGEVEEAARIANADAFIRKLPDGYDTVLDEGGGNLSQGQRQLITIARAVLANPRILILDEATSSVDTRTELHIQEAMRKLMRGRTSFVIAHRLGTIREADRILVIHGGEVIEQGTHEELLASGGFYAELYRNQYAGGQTG
jgi:ATP-binding cassette subfamily B protein